jgi:hypothetical protein
VDGLTRSKVQLEPCGWNLNYLITRAFEMHFDAGLQGIPPRAMTKARVIEIRVELPVESMQNVQIERRRYALDILVGRDQGRLLFYEIRTKKKRVMAT